MPDSQQYILSFYLINNVGDIDVIPDLKVFLTIPLCFPAVEIRKSIFLRTQNFKSQFSKLLALIFNWCLIRQSFGRYRCKSLPGGSLDIKSTVPFRTGLWTIPHNSCLEIGFIFLMLFQLKTFNLSYLCWAEFRGNEVRQPNDMFNLL